MERLTLGTKALGAYEPCAHCSALSIIMMMASADPDLCVDLLQVAVDHVLTAAVASLLCTVLSHVHCMPDHQQRLRKKGEKTGNDKAAKEGRRCTARASIDVGGQVAYQVPTTTATMVCVPGHLAHTLSPHIVSEGFVSLTHA